MRRFHTYFLHLASIRASVRGSNTKNIKRLLGDSINNNRTLTVSQLIRYAKLVGTKDAARRLEVVAAFLEQDILDRRNFRTDAIDINELVDTYRTQVIEKKKYRRQLGSILKD